MKYILTLTCTLFVSLMMAQDEIQFNPANSGTTFVTCNGFIIDSGGQGGPGYSDNENTTITVCPDTITAGDNSLYITTTYNLFQLDGTNTGTQQNPNLDAMSVYDGPNTSYPTLGTYNTNELENVTISATNLNPSGCLTFVFYSNGVGTGAFTGSVTCTQPCVPPTADAFIVNGDTPDSIRVCVGEPVTFDGSASYAANGFDIAEYEWSFMDGTVDNTTGPVITHSFSNPGQYHVQLVLTDDNTDNPCSNLNVVPLKVYVSNYPTFYEFPADTTICLGEQVVLTGISEFGQYDSTWTGFPGTNAVDDGCLTDNLLGVAQNIPVTYTAFDPSETITSVDDIVDICLSMEHSFMGDLIIQLSCPNGTTINLQTQGGGGTQIGVPVQADNVDCDDPSTQGEGWTYCWDNNATETWVEWVNANGGGTLPAGTYESVDPLSDLIGCPLIGTWQISVIDNWAADDGTIFEFGVTFDPSFYPDIVEFTNTVGESADSSFWDLGGADIIGNTSDMNEITILPSSVGTYAYTYSCVNDFGCEFDSTVTVTVIDGPPITAGPDQVFCVDPIQMQGGLAAGSIPPPDGMTWLWTPATGLSDTSVPDPILSSLSQNTVFTLTGYPVGFPACETTDQVTISLNPQADPGLDTDSILCYNSPTSFLVDYLDGTPALGGVWTDVNGDVVPDQFNPTSYPAGANFVYTYTVGDGNCVGQSQLNLTILDATNPSCCQTNAVAGDDARPCQLEYQLQAEPALGLGTWTGPANVSFSDIHDPNAIATCEYPGDVATLTWTDDNGFACSDFDEVTITFSEPLSVIVVPELTNCFNECTGTAVGVASGGTTPDGSYHFDWGDNGVAGVIPQMRDSLCAGSYQVLVEDYAGCKDSIIYNIGEPEAQSIFVMQSPPLCAEQCSGYIEINSEGAVDYSFDGGETFVSENSMYTCQGEYNVIARNANGCEISQGVTLIDPSKFEANFNINPLPTTTKNTLITFQDVSSPGPIQTSIFQYGIDPVLGEGNDRISSFKFPTDTSGTYPVILTSTNANGCTDTTMKNVIIHDDLLWYIPNSFSPNGDGINDIWRPVGNTLDIKDYELTIMDRWGNRVFSTKDYDKGWNGTKGGDGSYFVEPGVYTYLIKVSSATTEDKRELTGFITMIR